MRISIQNINLLSDWVRASGATKLASIRLICPTADKESLVENQITPKPESPRSTAEPSVENRSRTKRALSLFLASFSRFSILSICCAAEELVLCIVELVAAELVVCIVELVAAELVVCIVELFATSWVEVELLTKPIGNPCSGPKD